MPDRDDPARRRSERYARPAARDDPRGRGASRMAALAVLVAVVVVLVVIVSGFGVGGRHGHQATTARTGSSRKGGAGSGGRVRGGSGRRSGRGVGAAPYPVAQTTLSLVEPAAAGSDPAGGPRLLPTVVRYPRVAASDGGAPARGWPLIVFSQGFMITPQAYAVLLRSWAAAGYVVAAPTYPDTDPDVAGGPDENDIVNHPADLRFVIAALLRASRTAGGRLSGLLDPGQVALVGQSDGGDVSLAVAANSCCRDPAVRAAVILSGAELASFGGTYFTTGSVPLLVVQGSADTVNVPGCSALIYDDAPRPKYYLDLSGASHLEPYLNPGPLRRGVTRTVVSFLDAELGGRRGAFDHLLAAGSVGPGMSLSAGSSAPGAAPSCPGAP